MRDTLMLDFAAAAKRWLQVILVAQASIALDDGISSSIAYR